jgi:hypothetical protein
LFSHRLGVVNDTETEEEIFKAPRLNGITIRLVLTWIVYVNVDGASDVARTEA